MRKARRSGFAWAAAFCAAALLAPEARAQNAAALYRAGDYQAAIMAGETAGDADSLTAAAGAALADATLRETPCLDCFHRAHALAAHAIAGASPPPRAYVYLTVAIGYEARIETGLSARARYGAESKTAVETALRLAPDDPWVLATAGGWHIELARAAGPLLARMMYGARGEEGVLLFKRAFGRDPGDAVLQVQYALALSSYAFATMRADIREALAAAQMAPARDAYGAAMKACGAALLALLDEKNDAEYLKRVRTYLAIS